MGEKSSNGERSVLIFTHPWIIWLAPLPLLVWWLAPPRRQEQQAIRVPFLQRLEAAGGSAQGSAGGHEMSLWIRAFLWILILLALARPQWLEPPIERTISTRDLLLLVDLSGSMQAEDFKNSEGQTVDRLTAVKQVLGEFLLRREGDRVGLVVFGNAPFLQVPFTTDLSLCRQLLDETSIGMAGPRTAFGDAIGLGIRLFENSNVPTKTIIALTDGNDTSSALPPVEASRVARDREITIHTVAIGDPETVGEEKLDTEGLRQVAKSTGGEFFLALDRIELEGVYTQLDKIETHEVKRVSHRPRRDLYYWPLCTALLVSLIAHMWKLLFRQTAMRLQPPSMRLRVNPQTFELESIEQ
jgi:Ca-activated chloride channel family protein